MKFNAQMQSLAVWEPRTLSLKYPNTCQNLDTNYLLRCK